MAKWASWVEADRDLVVVHWLERGIKVVFPIAWTHARNMALLTERARARVHEVERKAGGRTVVAGSVLLAFSRHEHRTIEQTIDPEAPHNLLTPTEA